MNEFQAQLDRAFPSNSDLPLVEAVTSGIGLAEASMTTSRLLSGKLGADLRGHIRRAGILHAVHEAAEAGRLPFSSKLERMPVGGWHWVELVSGSVIAHIHRTDGPTMFPVDTPTRQDERYSNQGNFFDPVDSGDTIAFRCAWLMFGISEAGTLNHLCWGMPAAAHDTWLARSNVLRRLANSADWRARDEPAPKLVLRFKERVEEAILRAANDHRAA